MERDTGLELVFAAGQAAERRGWPNPTLIGIDDLGSQLPAGGPLIVTARANELTAESVRTFAALQGAGREVLLVTDVPLSDSLAGWIADEALVVLAGEDSKRRGAELPLNSAADRESGKEQWRPSPTPVASSDDRRTMVESVATSLADHPDPTVRRSVASFAQTPKDVLDRLGGDLELSVQGAVARNPNTSKETLIRFAREFDYESQTDLAVNPTLPVTVGLGLHPSAWHLALLRPQSLPSFDPWEISGEGIAYSSRVTPEMLRALACHGDPEIRAGVAFHRNAPKDVLLALLGDGHGYENGGSVQDCVAANRCTPADLLRRLAGTDLSCLEDEIMMKAIIGGHPNTPQDLLHQFAAHSEPWIRVHVAENSHLPATDLVLLARDTSEAEYEGREAGEVRTGVAMNPGASADLLRLLADDCPWQVAGNPKAPADVLQALAEKHAATVAANPNTPIEVLRSLASVYPAEVATNPGAPADVLHALADDDRLALTIAGREDTPVELLRSLALRDDDRLALTIAGREDTPVELLRSLALRADEALKFAVAVNPMTPEDTLSAIARDLR